jgi:uncharacterized protein (DUF2249 family)
MKINSKTRISQLIKHNVDAIEAIASINPHFNKLRNPMLRAVLAPRVSIADAARIGNCEIEDFFVKLSALGFEIERNEADVSAETPVETGIPQGALEEKIANGNYTSFDVRSILQEGRDPFAEIMQKVKELQNGEVLLIINSFEPTPLIRVMEKKGMPIKVETREDAVYTYAMKLEDAAITAQSETHTFVEIEILEARAMAFGDKLERIDVRAMEMPLPMMTILEKLEQMAPDAALFVDHKKVPQHLLPEIAERGWKTLISDHGEGDVKLLIFK